MSSKQSQENLVEGLFGLAGITLGLIPLVQFLWRGTPGWWRLVLGQQPGAAGWVVPTAVLLVCAVAIVVSDRRRRRD